MTGSKNSKGSKMLCSLSHPRLIVLQSISCKREEWITQKISWMLSGKFSLENRNGDHRENCILAVQSLIHQRIKGKIPVLFLLKTFLKFARFSTWQKLPKCIGTRKPGQCCLSWRQLFIVLQTICSEKEASHKILTRKVQSNCFRWKGYSSFMYSPKIILHDQQKNALRFDLRFWRTSRCDFILKQCGLLSVSRLTFQWWNGKAWIEIERRNGPS